jgi:hypothetical protein
MNNPLASPSQQDLIQTVVSRLDNPNSRSNLISQVLSAAIELMPNGIDTGVDEGCHPDFVNFLEENLIKMSAEKYYQFAILVKNYPTIILPSVSDFGIQLADVTRCMEEANGVDESAQAPKPLTNIQTSLLSYLKFSQCGSHPSLLVNNSVELHEGSILLYSGALFQPQPPTGKDLTPSSYNNQFIQCNTAYNTDVRTAQPMIPLFQRGEGSFAKKTQLLPAKYRQPEISSSTNAQDGIPPLMLVADTQTLWPFVMADSTNTANQSILSLLIPKVHSTALKLPTYDPLGMLPTGGKLGPNGEQCGDQNDLILVNILLTPKEGQECAICQCQYECGDEYVQLGCKHSFHLPCLKGWILKKHTCPTCRFKLPTSKDFSNDIDEDEAHDIIAARRYFGGFFM